MPSNSHIARTHLVSKVPTALAAEEVGAVRNRLEKEIEKYVTVNFIYVLSKENHLEGVVSIRKLLGANAGKKLSDIMTKSLIVAHPETDQEAVAHLALKNNLKAIPIVDKAGIFLGVVPSDAILSILYQETSEDFLKSAGIHPNHSESILTLSPFTAFRHRVIWIVGGLLGGLLTAEVIESFSATLNSNLVLAAFIPLVVYIGDAVGAQTQTLYVRDLATQNAFPFWRYFWRQLMVSFFLAIACSVLIWGVVGVFFRASHLGSVIAISIAASIMVASLIGLTIPTLLRRLRQDPADGSGPFATILTDIVSVSIYFSVASVLAF